MQHRLALPITEKLLSITLKQSTARGSFSFVQSAVLYLQHGLLLSSTSCCSVSCSCQNHDALWWGCIVDVCLLSVSATTKQNSSIEWVTEATQITYQSLLIVFSFFFTILLTLQDFVLDDSEARDFNSFSHQPDLPLQLSRIFVRVHKIHSLSLTPPKKIFFFTSDAITKSNHTTL